MQWLFKGAHAGDTDAQKNLGDIYDEGSEKWNIEPDLKKSFYWYNEAAKNGQAEAHFYVAKCYEEGYGTKKNNKEAERLREVAAALEQDECVESDVE